MKDFMSYNCNITKIHIACFVPPGFGDKVHKNRKFHGLAFHLTGNKTYIFSDGRRKHINAGDIIYLPKFSSYEVISEQSGNCYAINFDIDEDTDFAPFAIHTTNQTDIQQLYKQTVDKGGYINLRCPSVPRVVEAAGSSPVTQTRKTGIVRFPIFLLFSRRSSRNRAVSRQIRWACSSLFLGLNKPIFRL